MSRVPARRIRVAAIFFLVPEKKFCACGIARALKKIFRV
jgi:hypothetical protein